MATVHYVFPALSVAMALLYHGAFARMSSVGKCMSGKTAEMPLAEHSGLIVNGVIAGCQYIRGQRRIPLLSGQSEFGDRAAAHAVLLDFEDQLLTFFECFQAGFHHCFRVNENSDATIRRLNEAVTLFQVEILDDAIEHAVSLGLAWSMLAVAWHIQDHTVEEIGGSRTSDAAISQAAQDDRRTTTG